MGIAHFLQFAYDAVKTTEDRPAASIVNIYR